MKTEFEKKLKELGFSFQCHTDDYYILSQNNDTDSIINTQLILSEPVDEVIHGSRNNNKIQAIGSFKFTFMIEGKEQDFLILAFPNPSNHCVEFILILKRELMKRLSKKNRISIDNREIEIVFWLMPDNHLYDISGISRKGEWYFLSQSENGRMADGTDWDYSDCLNCWDRLMIK